MQSIISYLVRPYRSTYTAIDLGKKVTPQYHRTDAQLPNDRDQLLQYSYYKNKTSVSTTCLIYCHCNSGSRVESIPFVKEYIARGWNVCLFDFSGSGLSGGDYISLGHYEARDLQCVVKKMLQLGNAKILLWGRSMGAATIITYLSQAKFREEIVACVLDSPYASLWELLTRIASDKSGLPGFIVQKLIEIVRERIKKDHCFDIRLLEPKKIIGVLDTPFMFITSLMDEFVLSDQVITLYKLAASKKKQLEYIEKTHNSGRDTTTVNLGLDFLQKCLQDRMKLRKKLKVFIKNQKDVTGNNLANLIVEREKCSHLRKIKSQPDVFNFIEKQNNRKKSNITSTMKTEQSQQNNQRRISPVQKELLNSKTPKAKFSITTYLRASNSVLNPRVL